MPNVIETSQSILILGTSLMTFCSFQEEIRARSPKYNFKAVNTKGDATAQESTGDASIASSSASISVMPPQPMIPTPAMIPPGMYPFRPVFNKYYH